MSKNIVDACIECVDEFNLKLAFIPSRRQVDHSGGYVNNWTTETFSSYVKDKSNKIIIKRDHSGPGQGAFQDDGKESLFYDCLYLDAIHIDPWKESISITEGAKLTKDLINYCYHLNSEVFFEIGTEQSIFKYEVEELELLILYLKKELSAHIFERIKFLVIQAGTSLKENKNTGSYDREKLIKMVNLSDKYGFISKEHNGDYIPIELIKEKMSCGLQSINIAPEFGQIETNVYLEEIKNTYLFNHFFEICYNSRKWEKWVNKDFDPFSDKEKLINICGHYVLTNQEFLNKIKINVRPDIDEIIKDRVKEKLKLLYGI